MEFDSSIAEKGDKEKVPPAPRSGFCADAKNAPENGRAGARKQNAPAFVRCAQRPALFVMQTSQRSAAGCGPRPAFYWGCLPM